MAAEKGGNNVTVNAAVVLQITVSITVLFVMFDPLSSPSDSLQSLDIGWFLLKHI